MSTVIQQPVNTETLIHRNGSISLEPVHAALTYLALAWIKDTAGSSMLFYLLLSMYRFK